jgi:cytochrome c peroxidase
MKKVTWIQHLTIGLFAIVGTALAVYEFQHSRGTLETLQIPTTLVINTDHEPIQPLPLALDLDSDKVRLGERLYHDPRLSGDNTISCASCHDLTKGGTDQLPLSIGIGGAIGQINAPTVFNSAFNFVQFWDGRARTLEEQAVGPVHNPSEMGSNWQEIITKLSQDKGYQQDFTDLYADGITADAIVDAIATFERSLFTPNAPFDRYLRGEQDVMSEAAQTGFQLFKEYGCVACHQGINIGGNMYQTLGVMDDYFKHRRITPEDLGRYNVTGQPYNRHQFKVPTLRNIELTFPYLHDGSAATLEEVLEIMWNNQLGRSLNPDEMTLIIEFLKALTGEYRGDPL